MSPRIDGPTIITSDLHLDSQPRNEYRFAFVEKTLPMLINTFKYQRLICLGDLCQDKDRHNAELVNRVVNGITNLSKLCDVMILRGNHDYISPENPFFAFLSRIPNVTWVNKPTFTEEEVFLPHTRDYKNDWKGLKLGNTRRAFAHQTFQGANTGNHIMDGIPLDVFPKDMDVISGDVHVPQKLGRLRYVGAPYTINFGDSYEPRVLILRSDGKITTMPVRGPRKILLEIEDPRKMPEIMPKIKLNKGDMLKVRVKLDKFEEFPKIKTILAAWASSHGVIVHTVQPMVSPGKASGRRLERDAVKSDADHVKAYVAKINASKDVLEVGLHLMEEGS